MAMGHVQVGWSKKSARDRTCEDYRNPPTIVPTDAILNPHPNPSDFGSPAGFTECTLLNNNLAVSNYVAAIVELYVQISSLFILWSNKSFYESLAKLLIQNNYYFCAK
jgi:hypothetical protein